MTTLDADGKPHIAPMGPVVDHRLERLWLRPYRTSTTFQNLKRAGAGVFHVTDDVELIASTAVGALGMPPAVVRAELIDGVILADACRWYAFEIESLDDSAERTAIVGRIVDRGVQREFFGFNRAKHAVIEAAILATRIHLLEPDLIDAEFAKLASPVEKTGGAAEVRAFALLRDFVQSARCAAP